VLAALQGFWAPMLFDDLVMVQALEHGLEVDERTLSAADRADFAAGASGRSGFVPRWSTGPARPTTSSPSGPTGRSSGSCRSVAGPRHRT
jgi:hypothetical protein